MPHTTEKKIYAPEPVYASQAEIEEFVGKLSQALNFSYKDDLWLLASKLNGTIEIGSSGDEDSQSGSIVVDNTGKFKIFLSPFTSVNRDRFTIAHELGHFFLHYPIVRAQMRTSDIFRATRFVDENDLEQQLAEKEANWFAAELLMPRDRFIKCHEKNPESLASEFRVSSQAISIRKKALRLKDKK